MNNKNLDLTQNEDEVSENGELGKWGIGGNIYQLINIHLKSQPFD